MIRWGTAIGIRVWTRKRRRWPIPEMPAIRLASSASGNIKGSPPLRINSWKDG